MKTQEAIRKSCENCNFFSFRYYRTEYKFSLALGEGVCGVRKYTEEERAKLPFGFVCVKLFYSLSFSSISGFFALRFFAKYLIR